MMAMLHVVRLSWVQCLHDTLTAHWAKHVNIKTEAGILMQSAEKNPRRDG